MNIKLLGIGILVFLASCHSAKKVISPTQPKSNKDSTATSKTPTIKDSATVAEDILNSVKSGVFSYQTISGKLGVSIKAANIDQSVNASLKSAKDSLIWISLTGPFNIEGARAKITVDSALVINKLNSTVEKRSISYIQNLIHQPLTFIDIQSILTGGLLLKYSKLESFKGNADGTWQLVLSNGNIQNIATIDPQNKRVIQNALTDLKNPSRTCLVQYKNFQNTAAGWMPYEISINAQDKTPIKVELNYKQVNFNQTLDYPFNIPSKYSVRQ
ncbi:MAG: hypothetical protein DI598_02400 [Pseudopedobacter saltans]|uniref:DUF4292 domain-containing protein n=1 Tax=Pseudopedobacter saltans TaxID=151895 RepID=A0A2W5F710_9SPHI|nr:MAG: hypothetical protein DI598_02400 [Pseudopedobacter saltans]